MVVHRRATQINVNLFPHSTAKFQQDDKSKGDILTTDQLHRRCDDKHESATRKLFYIYLNGTTANNHKDNSILKFQLPHWCLKHDI